MLRRFLVTLLLILLIASGTQASESREVFRYKLLFLVYPDTFAASWDQAHKENAMLAMVKLRDWYEMLVGEDFWLQLSYAQADRVLGPEEVAFVIEDGRRKYQLAPNDAREDLARLGVASDVYGTVGTLNAWGANGYGVRKAGGTAWNITDMHVVDKKTNFYSVGFYAEQANPFAVYHEFTHCVDYVFKRSGLKGIGNIDSMWDYLEGIVAERPGWFEPTWSDKLMLSLVPGRSKITAQQQARVIRAFLDRPHEEFLSLSKDYGEVVEEPSGFRFEPVLHEVYGEPGMQLYLPVIARDADAVTPDDVEVIARVGDAKYVLTRTEYSTAIEGVPYTREFFADWVALPAGTDRIELELLRSGSTVSKAYVEVKLKRTAFVKGDFETVARPLPENPVKLGVEVVESGTRKPVPGANVTTKLGGETLTFTETTPGTYELAVPMSTPVGDYRMVIEATREGLPIASLKKHLEVTVPWVIAAPTRVEVTAGEPILVQAAVKAGEIHQPNVEMSGIVSGTEIPMVRGDDGVFSLQIPKITKKESVTLIATEKGGGTRTHSVVLEPSGGKIVPEAKVITVNSGEDVVLGMRFVTAAGTVVAGDSIPKGVAACGWLFSPVEDADGDGLAQAELSGLGTGTHIVRLQAPGYEDSQVTVIVESN